MQLSCDLDPEFQWAHLSLESAPKWARALCKWNKIYKPKSNKFYNSYIFVFNSSLLSLFLELFGCRNISTESRLLVFLSQRILARTLVQTCLTSLHSELYHACLAR